MKLLFRINKTLFGITQEEQARHEDREMLAFINAVKQDARLADVNSRAVYGRPLDELDLIRLRRMHRGVQV